ncbi:hypothetical protein ASG01_08530 [Chryseobacterium sp. Leaf180]|uniref:hypothetical protein n=1 Tax=Chryseobacterium sp. Leaf180 TaxID=1736289 RepID=UPI0006F7270F|nr:hypothetical protein [Chryseobacterium sp. Leaf180]KQR93895.1 hypothetical protein ASG01_08530 [Chryseobacterium sp. Leaf180]
MSREPYQDQYKKVVKDLKEEKMNWDFEDFLQKTESKKDEKVIPVKNKPSFPKWLLMAASLGLIFGLGLVFSLNQNSSADDQAKLVENEIKKQKSDFITENHAHETQVAVNYTDSVVGAKKDSLFQDESYAEVDALENLLSKRSRIKKERKPRYVSNTHKPMDSSSYKNSYVIVNGKRIDNLEEAINVTKYSFQVVANANSSLNQPKVMDNVED